MDRKWAAAQLTTFIRLIDFYWGYKEGDPEVLENVDPTESPSVFNNELIEMEEPMQAIMEAARPGLGLYPASNVNARTRWSSAREAAVRARGHMTLGAEIAEHLRPDAPVIAADYFHSWVWDAARPLWESGHRREAVTAASRSVNARLQTKVGRRDISESDLVRQSFSLEQPKNSPKLRLPGDRTSQSWKSTQKGAMDFGAGCFEAIRNPAAHDEELEWSEQQALEHLAAFSILARWIDAADVLAPTVGIEL